MQKKHSGAIGIIITIVLLTVLVIITNIDTSNFSFLEGIAQKLVMPVQNGLTYLKNKIAGNNTFFEDINNLKTENESLKKQNEELNKSLSELGIIKAENKKHYPWNGKENMNEKADCSIDDRHNKKRYGWLLWK